MHTILLPEEFGPFPQIARRQEAAGRRRRRRLLPCHADHGLALSLDLVPHGANQVIERSPTAFDQSAPRRRKRESIFWSCSTVTESLPPLIKSNWPCSRSGTSSRVILPSLFTSSCLTRFLSASSSKRPKPPKPPRPRPLAGR